MKIIRWFIQTGASVLFIGFVFLVIGIFIYALIGAGVTYFEIIM